jgi:hypothetical protein
MRQRYQLEYFKREKAKLDTNQKG